MFKIFAFSFLMTIFSLSWNIFYPVSNTFLVKVILSDIWLFVLTLIHKLIRRLWDHPQSAERIPFVGALSLVPPVSLVAASSLHRHVTGTIALQLTLVLTLGNKAAAKILWNIHSFVKFAFLNSNSFFT